MNEKNTTASIELRAEWQRLGIHRASQAARTPTWSSGFDELDRILPGRGYPLASVTEWLVERPGIGELTLLLSALAPKLRAHADHRLVLVNPPYRLNAPALDGFGIDRARLPILACRTSQECVWSIEQLAAAGGFVGFVLWADHLDTPALRRLQLASEKAGCPVFVYRPLAQARQRSPAALRLALTQRQGRQRIEILKCRGPAGARAMVLQAGPHRPWQSAVSIASKTQRIETAPADNDPLTPREPMFVSLLEPAFKPHDISRITPCIKINSPSLSSSIEMFRDRPRSS